MPAENHHEDYPPVEPSARETVARTIHAFMSDHDLERVNEVKRSDDRRCWIFSIKDKDARALVEVFSDSYIRVSWVFGQDYPDSRIYANQTDASAFLAAMIVLRDSASALAVPQRPVKERKRPVKFPEKEFDPSTLPGKKFDFGFLNPEGEKKVPDATRTDSFSGLFGDGRDD